MSEQQRPSTDHDVGDASGGHFGDHDFTDHDWNRAVRGETTTERLDRNWRDLLQELRVVQTGVQLLTGLLLTVPFHSSFLSLVHRQVVVYLVATGLSVLSVGLLVAPVIAHRLVFRRHGRRQLVEMGQRLTVYGLVTFGLAVVGVVELIFDVVLGLDAGLAAAATAFLLFGALWGVVPVSLRRGLARRPAQPRPGP